MEKENYDRFYRWLKIAKAHNPDADRLLVDGRIISVSRHICDCYISPYGDYEEGRLQYYIVRRNEKFVCEDCGKNVEKEDELNGEK